MTNPAVAVPDTVQSNKKPESWSRLDFLLENVCVPHSIQYNDSRASYAAVNIGLPFSLFSYVVSVPLCVLVDGRYSGSLTDGRQST